MMVAQATREEGLHGRAVVCAAAAAYLQAGPDADAGASGGRLVEMEAPFFSTLAWGEPPKPKRPPPPPPSHAALPNKASVTSAPLSASVFYRQPVGGPAAAPYVPHNLAARLLLAPAGDNDAVSSLLPAARAPGAWFDRAVDHGLGATFLSSGHETGLRAGVAHVEHDHELAHDGVA